MIAQLRAVAPQDLQSGREILPIVREACLDGPDAAVASGGPDLERFADDAGQAFARVVTGT